MQRFAWVLVGTALVSTVAGCGKSQSAGPPLAADSATPQIAVTTFLEAIRKGDDKEANRMLTPLARQKNQERGVIATPPGSATAKFQVGAVEYVTEEKDGAHVAATWSDIDIQGQPTSENFVWVMRKETEGWRIAGMAVKVWEDALPLILNFEDPDDVLRKQQLLADEMAKRAAAPVEQAKQPPTIDGRPLQ